MYELVLSNSHGSIWIEQFFISRLYRLAPKHRSMGMRWKVPSTLKIAAELTTLSKYADMCIHALSLFNPLSRLITRLLKAYNTKYTAQYQASRRDQTAKFPILFTDLS